MILAFLTILIAIPGVMPANAGGTPLVCITTVGAKCSTTPVQLTGTLGGTLVVWVAFHGKLINGFDIIVKADNSILVPLSADLNASIFNPSGKFAGAILKECVGGGLIAGSGCPPQAIGSDTVDMEVVHTGGLTGHHTVGDFFEIVYRIQAIPSSPIPIGFQTGCTQSDAIPPADPTTCVAVLNGTPTGEQVAVVTATFI